MTDFERRKIEDLLRYWDTRATDEETLRMLNTDAGDHAHAAEADARQREAVAAFNAIVDVVAVFGHRVKWDNVGIPRIIPDEAEA